VAAQSRFELDTVLHDREPAWPDGSETAILLSLNARGRAREADAAAAPIRHLDLPVNGVATPFTVVAQGERFAAVARLEDATIVIAGHGDPDGLVLEALAPGAV
jgi:hypothetical protein